MSGGESKVGGGVRGERKRDGAEEDGKMLCLKRAARLNFGKRARLGARIADSLRGSARAPTHAAVSTQTGLLDALIIPRRVATPVRPGGGGARPLGDQEQGPDNSVCHRCFCGTKSDFRRREIEISDG